MSRAKPWQCLNHYPRALEGMYFCMPSRILYSPAYIGMIVAHAAQTNRTLYSLMRRPIPHGNIPTGRNIINTALLCISSHRYTIRWPDRSPSGAKSGRLLRRGLLKRSHRTTPTRPVIMQTATVCCRALQ